MTRGGLSTASADRVLPALTAAATDLGLELAPDAGVRLHRYLALLQRWNAVYNLTAVRDPPQMLTQHLVDCMAIVPALRRWVATHPSDRPLRLLDVGSGGGLPGVVVAVLMPEVHVTCVDTVGKKAAFIRQVGAELALSNLRAEHARVEQLPGRFDLVASRAFSTLSDLVGLTQARLEEGGVWVAMKGKHPASEIADLPGSAEVFHVEPLHVPGLDAERCLVWMRLRR